MSSSRQNRDERKDLAGEHALGDLGQLLLLFTLFHTQHADVLLHM